MHHQSQSLQTNLKQLGRKKPQSDLIMQKTIIIIVQRNEDKAKVVRM